jgi:hypothetical protein
MSINPNINVAQALVAPNLPRAPQTYLPIYQDKLNNILFGFFTQVTNAINQDVSFEAYYGQSGTAKFSAANTVLVKFSLVMPVNTYQVLLGGNAAGYVWVTNKTMMGFTLNCSASNSNTTDWSLA